MKSEKNKLLHCIKSFRFHSIFIKNLFLIFCMLIMPFICVLVISIYTYGSAQENIKKSYSDAMSARIIADVNNIFKEIKEKAIMIGMNYDVGLFFYSKDIEQDQYYDVNNIFEYLSLYSVTNEIIESVYLYSTTSDVVISPAGRYRYVDFYDKECIQQWNETGDMYQINYLDRVIGNKKKRNICFYYAGQYGIEGNCIVIININLEKLRKQLGYGDSINLAIVNEDEIIFDSSLMWMGNHINDLDVYGDEKRVYLKLWEKLDQNNMDIMIHMDSWFLQERLDGIKAFLVCFVGVMIFLTIGLVIYISKKIYDPISNILDAINKEDSFKIEEKLLQSKDELNYIVNSIYATAAKNKNIEQQLSERLVLLKKAQTIALQAQIDPHFINNTLETINWMAIGQLGGENDISEMVDCLSQLLRISLENTDTFVTIKKEMDYAEKYLYIQQKRFGDKFTVIWNVPPDIQERRMIKMAFQPLIENAINYGIKPNDGKGELKIEAERIEEDIYIYIIDSGKGIVREKVNEINESMEENIIKESKHLGLSNVNQRIKLTFGEKYGVTISSIIGEGTTATIKVPY